MNKLLRTTFLTLLVAVVNVVMADTYSYTFINTDFKDFKKETVTQELNGVSWTLATNTTYLGWDGGTTSKGLQIGSANNPASSITLSTDGFTDVSKVVVNASTASGASATLSVKVGDNVFNPDSYSLTTTATNYTFTVTGSASGTLEINYSQPQTSKALYIKSIEVTYNTSVEQQPCDLSFSAEACEATIGAANTFPTLNNPHNLTDITYTSSDATVASVSGNGTVSLNSPGTTTITASFAGNAAYFSGEASYVLTVLKADNPEPTTGAFVKVTDASTLAEGDIIIIVNEEYSKAMSTTQNNNNRGATGVSITDYTINPGSEVQQITLEGSSEDGWYLNVGNGYLYAASSSSNNLKTQAKKNDNAKAAISIGNGEATIKFQGTNTRNLIRFNSSNNPQLFSCYESGQNPVQIYRMSQPVGVATSIAELAALADDSNVKLVFAEDANARVLFATDGEAYVRDNTGACCFSGVEPNVPFASNQHIAGSITGKKTSLNGMTIFQATNLTTTAFLAIAEPVTEEELQPVSVEVGDINNHLADWISVQAISVGADANVENRFNLEATDGFTADYAYAGALADVAAIARPEALCPVYVNGVTPFVFVIDEKVPFVAPATDLANVPLRLVRTISSDYWNTLCLPFGVSDWDAQIRAYTSVGESKMYFSNAEQIVAGTPYLVKPNATIQNPQFEAVTLSSTPAQTVTFGYYSFVGTYSPYEMLTNGTERFLGDGDNLYIPSSEPNANKLRGLRAFFRVPADSNANVDFTDFDGISEMKADSHNSAWFTLSGQRVDKPLRGIYIQNGKKIVVK